MKRRTTNMSKESKVRISRGKFEGIQACADKEGIIAAVAMDQRGALKKLMEQTRKGSATDAMLTTFKQKVAKVLTHHASAVLLDPEYGLPALQERASGTGALLAYEKTGYDANAVGRLPDLLPVWSARRLVEAGATAVKILLYYHPFDDERIKDIKHAFIERVGDECRALDVPFFLEPLVYDDRYDEKGLEFARLRPTYVRATIEEFSRPRYGVDVLKVEVPINVTYLEGSRAFKGGMAAYNYKEALDHFRAAAAAAKRPLLYLSGGVDDIVFRETLQMAAEAGALFNGVLCGRATWKGGVPVLIERGPEALEEWLSDQGVKNVQALNEVLKQCAHPWYTVYGGLENIEIVERS
jgi:tagatose 1,6-diphosphate aldolase